MEIPKLCKQKNLKGDLAYVKIDGTKFYCGKWDTPEAVEKYQRIVAEWSVTKQSPVSSVAKKEPVTINELVAAFLERNEETYMKNGRPTGSYERFVRCAKLLLSLYGSVPVNEFGPASLIALRNKIIDSRCVQHSPPEHEKKPLSRGYVNDWISHIRHIFKEGIEMEMVDPMTHYALCQVADLKKGRSKAIEKPPVRAVPIKDIEAAKKFMSSVVAAMVDLQLFSGMRPGEVRNMRFCDIDMSDNDAWIYVPWEYKTEHHGMLREIGLGPKCQPILTPYLMDKEETPKDWLFSPREAMAERHAKARERRKTKVQPSQLDRSKSHPKRAPGEKYSKESYNRAIKRACEKAGVTPWSPNQLRHTALTVIRAKENNLDAAQIIAGHANSKTTEIYAEKSRDKLKELTKKYC